MFPVNRVTGVSNGEVRIAHHSAGNRIAASAARSNNILSGIAGMDQATQVLANLSGPAGFAGGASTSVNSFWNSQYQYMMTGILPADPSLIDTSSLALFFRDIYLFDNTAGSAIDIQSTFTFSDWDLRGLPEHELQYFDDALAQLNIETMMSEISVAYLTDGFFCGSLVFDPISKQFLDTLKHDALACTVLPSPFHNIDPTINVRVSQAVQQFVNDTSAYAKQYLAQMPHQFTDMLRSGAFTLDPVTTLFVGRKTLSDRAYVSYLHRILPMYLIEKTLFRGTLVEVARRQRAITHLTAGDDTWTPSGEELNALVGMFQAAEFDPLGGWVASRNAVQTVDVRPAGDFLKWTDMMDVLSPYKLRALGISESFLSSEQSYASAEQSYSTFLESQNAYRNHLTDQVFNRKLFPLIAVVNGLMDDRLKAKGRLTPKQLLFNASNRAMLRMPTLHWTKSLEAKGEDNLFDMLEKASDKGVPIPLKMWMAAAGIDSDALLKDLKDDAPLRKQLEKYTGKDTTHEGEEEYDEEGGDVYASRKAFNRILSSLSDRDLRALRNNGGDSTRARRAFASVRAELGAELTSLSLANNRTRVGIGARSFSGQEMSRPNKSGSGRHHVLNSRVKERDFNAKLAKIAADAEKDPHYRMELKKRNIERTGRATTTLAGGIMKG
ncbi:hypothetical protein [Burkholderia phage BCSR5]|nr:hypothetical protein [Burkholderia phage BCSR5]